MTLVGLVVSCARDRFKILILCEHFVRVLRRCFLSSIFLSTVPCILPAVGCVAAQHHSSTSQWQRSASSARSTRGKEEEKEIEEREGTCQSTGHQELWQCLGNQTTKMRVWVGNRMTSESRRCYCTSYEIHDVFYLRLGAMLLSMNDDEWCLWGKYKEVSSDKSWVLWLWSSHDFIVVIIITIMHRSSLLQSSLSCFFSSWSLSPSASARIALPWWGIGTSTRLGRKVLKSEL